MTRPIIASIALALLSLILPRGQAQEPAAISLTPMAANATPAFEVATVRPSKPDSSQKIRANGHRVGLEDYSVSSMISLAYNLHKSQVIGGPAWLDSDRYDVDGVPDTEGQPSMSQMQLMFQELLADRFALKFHHDKRELPVYVITIAKGGPKLRTSNADPMHPPDVTGGGSASQQTMKFTNITMAGFTLEMLFQLGKPVLDQTGLTGHYDFTLQWARDDASPADPNAPPGFFTAIQEQLGLKMEPKKDLADVLIIDHAEKPSEN
jgi:uncharacterized protein (TIGR03435 family)